MGMFGQVLKEVAACFLALLMMAGGSLFPAQPAAFEAQDAANLNAQFSVFSDVHVDIYQLPDYINRMTSLRLALGDIANSAQTDDALVLLGDTLDENQIEENLFFYLYMMLFQKLPRENTLMAVGNHETYYTHDYHKDVGKFLRNYSWYTGETHDKSYFAKDINGYRYIVLGTQSTVSDEGDLTPAQNAWLDAQLAEATQNGKPVFVFNHQPFPNTHGYYYEPQGVIGEQYQAIYNTLAKYDNIFFFSGHLHWGWNASRSFQTTPEGVHLLNLPSFGKELDQGQGVQVEVYNDRVLLRARNFARGAWMEDFVFDVPLV